MRGSDRHGATLPRVVLLRDLPGLPDADLRPPVVAQASDDPFAALRVVHLVARLPRGESVRLRDIVDRLNADHVDWSFTRPVVTAVIIQLQANWMADYRNASGIVLEEGPHGAVLTIEDSSRVDPWIVRQADRLADECREQLRSFAVEEGTLP